MIKIMKNIKFTGSIPAIITPFKKNGGLDLEALKRLVKYQIDGGVDAIVACGSTGEAATLEDSEYVSVIKTVIEIASGKIPVIAGAGSNDTKKAIHFSLLAKKAGADGLLHVTPFYNKPTTSGLIAHYSAIAKVTKMPIILYNVPGRTGSNVLPAAILKIAKEVPEVIAVKEASGSINQMMEILKGGLTVLSGDDSLTLPLIAVGGHGCISVVCNEAPKLFSDMVHAGLDGNLEKARKFHYQLWELMNINFIESNPIPVKTALSMMGMIEESFRLPLTLMDEKNRPALQKILKDLKLI